MLKSWFKEKKIKNAYAADIKTLTSLYADVKKLDDKIKEINETNMSDEQKESLIAIIDGQKQILSSDIEVVGLNMTKYFEGNVISKSVPLGVDLSEYDFYEVEKNEITSEHIITLNTSRSGFVVSNFTERISKRMTERDVANEVTNGKIKTIKRVPLKSAIKDKLTAMHLDKKEERKQNLISYVKDVNPPLPSYKREANIIKPVVLDRIDQVGMADMVNDLSINIVALESSLVTEDYGITGDSLGKSPYKKVIDINPILNMDMNSHITTALKAEVKEGWIQALRETGDFIVVKGA